jgi:hypothetical protein
VISRQAHAQERAGSRIHLDEVEDGGDERAELPTQPSSLLVEVACLHVRRHRGRSLRQPHRWWRRGELLDGRAEDGLPALVERGLEQLRLAREVMVERAPGDLRPPRDLLELSGGEPAFGEHEESSVEQGVTSLRGQRGGSTGHG